MCIRDSDKGQPETRLGSIFELATMERVRKYLRRCRMARRKALGSGQPAGNRGAGAGENSREPRDYELSARAQSGMDRPLARGGPGAVGQL